MRKARLVKQFIERANQGDNILCQFHRTIDLEDVPPIGYTVTFLQQKRIARFYVERADIQNKSGNITLYSSMEIQRYENWDYDHSVGIIKSMQKEGWQVKKIHKLIKDHKNWKNES